MNDFNRPAYVTALNGLLAAATDEQLDRLFPGLKEQYIRTYGNQYMIESGNSQKLMRLFHRKCEKYGIVHDNDQIFRYLSAFEEKDDGGQLSIWD